MSRHMILDGTYLAYRAFFSTGGLEYKGESTGVTFGFLRALQSLTRQFYPDRTVICFDHGKGLREQKFPYYKESRRKRTLTDEQEAAFVGFRTEVSNIKKSMLHEIGYNNVFFQEGYEADDVIASIAKDVDEDDTAVIVTGDHDLYQCIRKNIAVFHPNSTLVAGNMVNRKLYKSMFGVKIKPSDWIEVKAIAGCKSDDIPGVDGVGEKTAAKFVAGKLKKKSQAYKDIIKFQKTQQYVDNTELVTLPMIGCKRHSITKDRVTNEKWKEVTSGYGMKSLADNSPIVGVSEKFR